MICTGVMFGYCATGNAVNETSPATTISSDSTVAKIGRSIKNLENMLASGRRQGLLAGAFGAAGTGAAADTFAVSPAFSLRPPSTTT